jgi:DNA-binding XRE family transcriptional regulator
MWYYDTVAIYTKHRTGNLKDIVSNLVTGRQLRAARVLAGLTQRTLGAALGVDERQIRFWERRHHSKLSGTRHHASIERALLDHGVILFAEPTPGARLVGDA